MSIFRSAALACLLAPVALLANPIGSVTSLVVFGDSLSDNGNAASVVPGGLGPLNYAPNAATDGPNTTPPVPVGGPLGLWVDQLAPKLGVADPAPFVAGGTNYAVATALSGHNPAFNPAAPITTIAPFTSDQVGIYSVLHGGVASPTALYTLWSGANDLTSGVSPFTAADNEFNNILALAAQGGKQFMWLNLPPLGSTPDATAAGPAAAAALNAASAAYNFEWSVDIAKLQALGIDVIGVDVNTLFLQIAANPAAFGFTNITDAAWFTAANPDTYLFWDGQHPTTAADALIATTAYNDFLAAPEPASVALGILGLLSLLALKAKFRFRGDLR
jgi:outer membrane lipase/esterase